MELLSQLDGFENLGQVKIVMATNRPDILDPALMRCASGGAFKWPIVWARWCGHAVPLSTLGCVHVTATDRSAGTCAVCPWSLGSPYRMAY
jgi:hypothetical protein